MIKEPFEIQNQDNLTIRGYILKEESDTQKPAVIISHGFKSTMKRTYPDGEFVAKCGYVAVIFDFCGGSHETTSDGSFSTYMTPFTEKNDLLCVLEYVRNRKDVDSSRIVLAGNSMGGFVSVLASTEVEEKIKGIALQYPALCIPDHARSGHMQNYTFDVNNIPDEIGELKINGNYPRSIMNMDIYEEMKKYHGPVMITHGTKDAIVPVEYALKAKEVYEKNGNDLMFHLIEGSDHGYFGSYFEEGSKVLKEFLEHIF